MINAYLETLREIVAPLPEPAIPTIVQIPTSQQQYVLSDHVVMMCFMLFITLFACCRASLCAQRIVDLDQVNHMHLEAIETLRSELCALRKTVQETDDKMFRWPIVSSVLDDLKKQDQTS